MPITTLRPSELDARALHLRHMSGLLTPPPSSLTRLTAHPRSVSCFSSFSIGCQPDLGPESQVARSVAETQVPTNIVTTASRP